MFSRDVLLEYFHNTGNKSETEKRELVRNAKLEFVEQVEIDVEPVGQHDGAN